VAAAKQLDDEDVDVDGYSGGAGLFADINITPLTDVFLVMLIIFMISALAVQAQAKRKVDKVEEQVAAEKRSGLKVNLPSGAAQEIDPTKDSIVLIVPVSGEVMMNDRGVNRIIAEADIDALFRAAFANNKMTQVVLQADKGVQHGRVVNLMERAKKVGLSRLAIGTSSAP
jgi:biopolymer transport protein ExbD